MKYISSLLLGVFIVLFISKKNRTMNINNVDIDKNVLIIQRCWNGIVKNGKELDEFTLKGGKLIGGDFMGNCLMASRKNTKKLALKPFAKLTPKVSRYVSYQFEYEY